MTYVKKRDLNMTKLKKRLAETVELAKKILKADPKATKTTKIRKLIKKNYIKNCRKFNYYPKKLKRITLEQYNLFEGQWIGVCINCNAVCEDVQTGCDSSKCFKCEEFFAAGMGTLVIEGLLEIEGMTEDESKAFRNSEAKRLYRRIDWKND